MVSNSKLLERDDFITCLTNSLQAVQTEEGFLTLLYLIEATQIKERHHWIISALNAKKCVYREYDYFFTEVLNIKEGPVRKITHRNPNRTYTYINTVIRKLQEEMAFYGKKDERLHLVK